MKSCSGGLFEWRYCRNKAYAVFDRSLAVAIVSNPSGLSMTMTLSSSNTIFKLLCSSFWTYRKIVREFLNFGKLLYKFTAEVKYGQADCRNIAAGIRVAAAMGSSLIRRRIRCE